MITEKYGLQTFEDTDEADLPKYSKKTNEAIIEALDNNKGDAFTYEDFTQEQLDDLRADINNLQHAYQGTNITANTVEGCGRINKVYGTEEGVGTDVNLFNEQNYDYLGSSNVDATGLIITSEATEFEIIYIPVKSDTVYTISSNKVKNFVIFTTNTVPAIGVQGTPRVVLDTQKYTLTTNSDTKYICLRNVKTPGNVQNYLNIELKVQEGSIATPYSPCRKRYSRNN